MCAVRLVDEEDHARLVHDLGNRTHIGGDAVIRRRDEEERLRFGMLPARAAHRLLGKAVRYAQLLVHHRPDADRTRVRQHERAEDGAMRVARHEHGIARREHGEHHRMDRPRRAVDGEEGGVRAAERGGERLRLLDAARRLVQIVQLLHQGDFLLQSRLRHQLPQERVRARSLLVPRRMKSKSAVFSIRTHSGDERRSPLSFVCPHFFSAFSGASTFGRKGIRR